MIEKMLYSKYKRHYSDCKTVYNSYDKDKKTIEVIIPEGRIKPNGVRGKRFRSYQFEFTNNKGKFKTTYKAVCKENAIKNLVKDFKPINYKLIHIY